MIVRAFSLLSNYLVLNQIGSGFIEKYASHLLKFRQLQGAKPPDRPNRGFASGPHWGLCPQTPIIGSRYRARDFVYCPVVKIS